MVLSLAGHRSGGAGTITGGRRMTEAKHGSTMSTGAPAASDRNALSIGPDGPIMLHDVNFLAQMAHFNREKVPERPPHATGQGEFGVDEGNEAVIAYPNVDLVRKGTHHRKSTGSPTVAWRRG